MNNLEMEAMYGVKAPITEKTIDNIFLANGIPLTHIARSNAKTTMSMKELCDMIHGVMFDEFMKISENDMREMYPEIIWYCDGDILATKKALNDMFGADKETVEEKKERERESYLEYKEFVMKKKGHKGGYR